MSTEEKTSSLMSESYYIKYEDGAYNRKAYPKKIVRKFKKLVSLYKKTSTVNYLPKDQEASHEIRDIHDDTPEGTNGFTADDWKNTIRPLVRYAAKNKLWFISVGCGKGFIEGNYINEVMNEVKEEKEIQELDDLDHLYGVVAIDPEPASFNKYDTQHCPISWSTVEEMIKNCPQLVGNCVLVANWASPWLNYDFYAIQDLKPHAVVSCFEAYGAAGGEKFHHWLNLSGYVLPDLCDQYSANGLYKHIRILHDCTKSLTKEERLWVKRNPYEAVTSYSNSYSRGGLIENILIKHRILTVVQRKGVKIDISSIPQNTPWKANCYDI